MYGKTMPAVAKTILNYALAEENTLHIFLKYPQNLN